MGGLQRLAVLTSGGDAPGMNATIRAAVRAAAAHGIETLGIMDGFKGLLAGRFEPLDERAVAGILHRGGTILGTARCLDFVSHETQLRALAELERQAVDALVVVGGSGSQQGSLALHALGFPSSASPPPSTTTCPRRRSLLASIRRSTPQLPTSTG